MYNRNVHIFTLTLKQCTKELYNFIYTYIGVNEVVHIYTYIGVT